MGGNQVNDVVTPMTYNGGGGNTSRTYGVSGSGGGATHIAKISGELKILKDENNNPLVNDILLVAGGGGAGGASWYSAGGVGGGANGGAAGDGRKATQSTGNEFGQGRDVTGIGESDGHGGGGGGYWGGYESNTSGGDKDFGGGGSGYLSPNLSEKSMTMYCDSNCDEYISEDENTLTIITNEALDRPSANSAKKGNGYAKITLISID